MLSIQCTFFSCSIHLTLVFPWWHLLVSSRNHWIERKAFKPFKNIMWKAGCSNCTFKCWTCTRNTTQVNYQMHIILPSHLFWYLLFRNRSNSIIYLSFFRLFLSERYRKSLLILSDVWSSDIPVTFSTCCCRILLTTRDISILDPIPRHLTSVIEVPSGLKEEESLRVITWILTNF